MIGDGMGEGGGVRRFDPGAVPIYRLVACTSRKGRRKHAGRRAKKSMCALAFLVLLLGPTYVHARDVFEATYSYTYMISMSLTSLV